ncbi:hypothetical protein BKA62DRAFT_77350 [Auriculariales sp. MPI-PUGE-AT-0066]|nr:hypothetical protein BKA62DRAFT_77350 [Auriculariales sp. MPI-PUGE-AT-0066]
MTLTTKEEEEQPFHPSLQLVKTEELLGGVIPKLEVEVIEAETEPLNPSLQLVKTEEHLGDVIPKLEVEVIETAPADLGAWKHKTLADYGLAENFIGECPDDAANLWVRRDAICSAIESGQIETSPSSRDGRYTICIGPNLNSLAPVAPGRHGIIFTFQWRAQTSARDEFRLFIRHKKLANATWLYYGEYRNIAQFSLPPHLWRQLPNEYKLQRVKNAIKRKSTGMEDIKANIVKRRKKKENLSDEESVREQVTSVDLLQSLDAGLETVQACVVEFVRYDDGVTRAIRQSRTAGATTSSTSAKKTGTKRKRPSSISPPETNDRRRLKRVRSGATLTRSSASDDEVSDHDVDMGSESSTGEARPAQTFRSSIQRTARPTRRAQRCLRMCSRATRITAHSHDTNPGPDLQITLASFFKQRTKWSPKLPLRGYR